MSYSVNRVKTMNFTGGGYVIPFLDGRFPCFDFVRRRSGLERRRRNGGMERRLELGGRDRAERRRHGGNTSR